VSEADVVVVGAGPTGLALALQAHDHGARVRVVERRPGAFRPSRALIVHPRTLEVLRPLGVTDALLAGGDISPAVHLHLGRREIPVQLGSFDIPDTAFPHLLFERQAVVEAVLADALADRGVKVERGVDLVEVRSGPDDAEVMLRQAGRVESVSCRFVAGCDGAESTVRRLAGVGLRGGFYAQQVLLADVELNGDLAPGVAHIAAGRDGVLFVFSIGEHATWRLLATRPWGHAQPSDEVSAHEVQNLLDDAGLVAGVDDVAWSSRVQLQHRIASRYRQGPLFLVGDAAHVHSPAGGQGMNTGIQDALNLGWKLAFAASDAPSRPGRTALLDSYECERRPVARQVLALTHALFWAEAGTGPLAKFARGSLAPLASPAVPYVLRQRRLVAEGVRLLSQLRVHYRRSALSVEGSPPGCRGPRPGDRLPDAPVDVAGRRWRLHELLAHPGVHVLLERDAISPEQRTLGPLVRVHRILDRPGAGAVIVRPDGYVGFRSASVDADRVGDWLSLIAASRQCSQAPKPRACVVEHTR
jgi:2-polyprenyl-6-methoxyphenol hydroxylase-like FAD-dependent oxidoreductase